MDSILKILPLGVLILVAIIFIMRGLRTKPDPTNNKARGGGPDTSQGM